MSARRIRVVIAEDQRMVLGALAALLSLEPDIEVVAQAGDGGEALAMSRAQQPDVLITDVEMPLMSGLEVARLLQAQAQTQTRVIILSNFARAGYLRRALEAGAYGYVLKAQSASELAAAVRRVHQGMRVIDPKLAAESWSEDVDPLTPRQRELLRLAAEGLTTANIGAQLRISPGTVRNYLSEAILKLGAANRIDAARIARRKGWL
jgi:two-component system, NarL family, response regulator DesR